MGAYVTSLRILLPCFLFLGACALAPSPLQTQQAGDLPRRQIRRIAVLGVTSVPEAERKMTAEEIQALIHRSLHAALAEFQDWRVVSEGEVEEARASMASDLSDQGRARRLGELVHADAVLFGRVLYFRQRVGEEGGVSRPASASFALDLVDVKRGDVVWKANYEETQRPLSENLLAIAIFAERGARWLKAEELVEEGITKAVHDLHKTLLG